MLAVQRSSMGSSKPPNLDMPFGYSFDTANSNFPFPSPTAPAPGPSLLDDNESKFLDNFFEDVSSDHFNYNFFNSAPDGSELGLGWNELPPTFMGTSSSFGQQPQIGAHGLSDPTFGDINSQMNPGPSIPASTSADVLAAASVLQNGSSNRSHSMSDGVLFRGQNIQPINGQSRAQSMSLHSTRAQPGFQPRPAGGDDFMRDTYYSDMIFGGPPEGPIHQRGPSQKLDIRWGSDSAFGTPQGFIAPPSQDNVAASERSHMQAVENAFSIMPAAPSSANTTRPSSPVHAIGSSSHQRTTSFGQVNDVEDQDSRPRKRRRSKFQEEVDEEDDSLVSVAGRNAKKRKTGKKIAIESPVPESEQGHKRRKSSAAAAAKASRENLTEDQKRENHIKSEQKRRTLIREGFEDLGELVPGLRGGGFSKSAVLIMAADWLEDLIQGNEVLQGRLDQMEGR